LRALGHSVLVLTSDHFVATASGSGLPAAPAGRGIRLSDLGDPTAVDGIEDAPYAHGVVFATMAAGSLGATLDVVDAWRPDLVVAERAEWAGPIAAAARGIPYVELRWGVAELSEYRAAAESILDTALRGLGLTALPRPSATLDPWPPSLQLPYVTGHKSLRHVPYNGPERVLGWMYERGCRTRVCVTLGTVLPHLPTQVMTAMLGGIVTELTALGCEIVVAVDDEIGARLQPLPQTVLHAGRVPLSTVLQSCDVLVHHGGQGTALTALASGCPQVVLPKFDDQLENAAAVVKSGAGLALPFEQATPPLVAEHCQHVLRVGRYADAARAVAAEIAEQPSPLAVAVMLERLAAAAG
jgi:UDP:flavonoid glycosyltransferase YjiC (YdhE family)